jgi:signal transduction histidine kinase
VALLLVSHSLRPVRDGLTKSIPLRSVGLLLSMLMMLFARPVASEIETKRVVLLHSYGRDFQPWSEYARAIRSELERQSPWRLEISDHSLMTARFSDKNPEPPFVEYLRAVFAQHPPDLIVSLGAPAADFVQRNREPLFGTTPMLFTAVEPRRVSFRDLTPNDAVVAGDADFSAMIDNVLRVLPDTKTIAVVIGNSPNERVWLNELRKEFKPFEKRVNFIWFNDLSFEELLKQAAALPPHSAIFWCLMSVDAAGMAHEGGNALRRLHDVTNAPIFSFTDAFLGQGIVGGPMTSVAEIALQTRFVARRILSGVEPGYIEIPLLKYGAPKFDWRELQRWGIDEGRLPPRSEVLFREPTAWERYRWQMTSIFLALLIQSAIVLWLLMERYARRRAESRSRGLSLEVMHLNRAAEAGALSASFAHDLSQPLVSIALNAQRAGNLLTADQLELGKLKEAVAHIGRANDHASEIIGQFRKLLKRRSDQDVQEADLNAVIADAVDILSSEADQRHIVLDAKGRHEPLLVRADPVHLLQVVLNLATNAMDAMADNAGDARRISIRTTLHRDSKVEVAVMDSGPGIPEQRLSEIFDTFYTTKEHGTGIGLSIARTIIETYGGKIWAENRAEGGAALRFTIPLVVEKTVHGTRANPQ